MNAHGSEIQNTDYAGNGGQAILYYPTGQVLANPSGSYPNNLYQIFGSLQLADTATDEYVPPFRYYIPEQGRWLTPDPLAGDITNPQSLNRYAYVRNNPMTLTDRRGLGDCGGNLNFPCNHPGPNCEMDGVPTPCDVVTSAVGGGAAAVCPYGCEGVNGNGQPVYFFASATGAGYFTYSGPGALYYSIEAALAAGALASQQAAAADSVMREYGPPVYTEAGVYSFGLLQQGPPCNLDTGACGPWGIDVTAIPEGATVVGLAHNHPGTGYGAYSFSEGSPWSDIETYIDNGYYGSVATEPPGRVLIFDPNKYNAWVNGQSNTAPVCVWQGPLMGVPSCH